MKMDGDHRVASCTCTRRYGGRYGPVELTLTLFSHLDLVKRTCTHLHPVSTEYVP